MSEVEIDGMTFLCNKLPTRKQLHVAKRILPVLKGLQPLFAGGNQRLVSGGNGVNPMQVVPDISIIDGLAALTDTLGMMPDSDMDFIVDNCLDMVKWKQGDRWMPLRQGSAMMVQAVSDDLATQLRLVWEVLNESLSSFSLEKLLNSPNPNQTAAA